MNTTATPEREVKTLPVCDVDEWNRLGAEYVAAHVSLDADAEERARVAGQIAKEEAAIIDEHRPQRDAAAFALIAHYRLRRGANLAGALGVNRTRLKVMKDKKADELGIPRDATKEQWAKVVRDVRNAPKVVADKAEVVARANGRFSAARAIRDEAVQELLAVRDSDGKQVWTNARIATLIGTDPSRVSHIKHKGAAA